jgi:hypothetical protein
VFWTIKLFVIFYTWWNISEEKGMETSREKGNNVTHGGSDGTKN